MKRTSLALFLFVSGSALAQTATTHSTVHHTSTTTSSAGAACTKLPELSPKIPALPPGLPCARPLYTITTAPSAKFDYISPLETPDLKEALGLETNTFSLSYIDVKQGTGELAGEHKWYTMNYTGYLVDGTKFDSSFNRNEPFTFPYGAHKVIPGWDTGFVGMRVGGKRRLFVPSQLGYGPRSNGPIPANAMLVFDVELVAISDTQPAPKTPPAPPAPSKQPTGGASPQTGAAPATLKPAAPPPASNTTPAPATPPKP